MEVSVRVHRGDWVQLRWFRTMPQDFTPSFMGTAKSKEGIVDQIVLSDDSDSKPGLVLKGFDAVYDVSHIIKHYRQGSWGFWWVTFFKPGLMPIILASSLLLYLSYPSNGLDKRIAVVLAFFAGFFCRLYGSWRTHA